MSQINKADLTPTEQRLIELMQVINFGRISNLWVCGGKPEFTTDTVIEREIKLGGQNGPRPERNQDDFLVKKEVIELLEHLSQMGSGKVCLLEIKHGLPFLMRIEQRAV